MRANIFTNVVSSFTHLVSKTKFNMLDYPTRYIHSNHPDPRNV